MALRRHPEFLEEADLILAMTEKQALESARQLHARLGASDLHPARASPASQGDIEDPWLEGIEVWVACREEIKRLLPR